MIFRFIFGSKKRTPAKIIKKGETKAPFFARDKRKTLGQKALEHDGERIKRLEALRLKQAAFDKAKAQAKAKEKADTAARRAAAAKAREKK